MEREAEVGPRHHHDLTKIFTEGPVRDDLAEAAAPSEKEGQGLILLARFRDKFGRPFEAKYRLTFESWQGILHVALLETAPLGPVSGQATGSASEQ